MKHILLIKIEYLYIQEDIFNEIIKHKTSYSYHFVRIDNRS